MDQIYKTDLNELFSYQRKGEKLEEKEKVIEIEIERLRDFKEYASKKDIMDGIVKKYRLDLLAPPEPADEAGNASGGQDQAKDESSQPQTKKQQTRDKKKTGGSNLQTSPRARRTPPQETKAGGECQWADLISYTKPMCRIGQSSCISISMTAWIRSERRGRG